MNQKVWFFTEDYMVIYQLTLDPDDEKDEGLEKALDDALFDDDTDEEEGD